MPAQLLNKLETCIIESAKQVAGIEMKQNLDGFTQSNCMLRIQIELRNIACKLYRNTKQSVSQKMETNVHLAPQI